MDSAFRQIKDQLRTENAGPFRLTSNKTYIKNRPKRRIPGELGLGKDTNSKCKRWGKLAAQNRGVLGCLHDGLSPKSGDCRQANST